VALLPLVKMPDVETKRVPQLARNPNVSFRTEGNGILLVNPATRAVYHLNETAAAIWEACEKPRMTQEVVDALAEQYELSSADIAAILKTVDDMARSSLFVIQERAGDPDTYLHRVNTTDGWVINPTMAFIWGVVDGSRTPDDIVRALVAEFDVTEDVARGAVDDALAYFREHGLVGEGNDGP
jgi:hypothetical protein